MEKYKKYESHCAGLDEPNHCRSENGLCCRQMRRQPLKKVSPVRLSELLLWKGELRGMCHRQDGTFVCWGRVGEAILEHATRRGCRKTLVALQRVPDPSQGPSQKGPEYDCAGTTANTTEGHLAVQWWVKNIGSNQNPNGEGKTSTAEIRHDD